eukprot:CAMPEP_0197250312 /NCGR_PEP_ID=MMETSP1429-20130617/52202_1 /TAXON_ID=49237 /ORGANISM="Chaetoceros  sp., Strain UNC1202" /LENGTH=89 /DNA_ID=CAMNT_0042712105 /DNA_START=496 /DNA_END=765 /DNA_ORIENTATION=+
MILSPLSTQSTFKFSNRSTAVLVVFCAMSNQFMDFRARCECRDSYIFCNSAILFLDRSRAATPAASVTDAGNAETMVRGRYILCPEAVV